MSGGLNDPRSLLAMIGDGRRHSPDLDVLTFVDIDADGLIREEVRTYAQLWRNGLAVAAALSDEGMQPGDSFAVIAQNHPEFVDAMVGSSMASTLFVPIDSRTQGDKLTYMLERAGCRGAVVADYALQSVLSVLRELPRLEWIWVIGDGRETAGPVRLARMADILARDVADAAVELPALDAPMQMLYTSGTTGDPKAILSTHARFAAIGSLGPTIGYRADDRPYTGLPLTHANAQMITLGNALSMGLRLVISRKFTKSRLWEILCRFECTTFNLLGGMVIAIFAEPPGRFDRQHKVRFVLSAGMPSNLWEPFRERYGVEIFEFYGAAEGGLTLHPPGAGPVGSVGKTTPNLNCAILDEDDCECAPFEHGEICFRNADGTVAPVEYFRDPVASRAKTRGGWFRSGDFGYKDADGWVYFSHRGGASIRRNGEFINAGDVEAHIASLPGVADVHIYGCATSANAPGEHEIVAAVVLDEGTALDPCKLLDTCARTLPRNSVPTFVQLVRDIPKTASEKPQARLLKDQLNDEDSQIFNRHGPTKIALAGENT